MGIPRRAAAPTVRFAATPAPRLSFHPHPGVPALPTPHLSFRSSEARPSRVAENPIDALLAFLTGVAIAAPCTSSRAIGGVLASNPPGRDRPALRGRVFGGGGGVGPPPAETGRASSARPASAPPPPPSRPEPPAGGGGGWFGRIAVLVVLVVLTAAGVFYALERRSRPPASERPDWETAALAPPESATPEPAAEPVGLERATPPGADATPRSVASSPTRTPVPTRTPAPASTSASAPAPTPVATPAPPPRLRWKEAPEEGARVRGREVRVSWEPADGADPPAEYVAGMDVDPPARRVSQTSLLFAIDAPGAHVIRVAARGADGTLGPILSRSFVAEPDRPPTVEASLPRTAIEPGESAELVAHAVDPEGGEARLELSIAGGPWSRIEPGASTIDGLAIGIHELRVRGVDAGGNASEPWVGRLRVGSAAQVAGTPAATPAASGGTTGAPDPATTPGGPVHKKAQSLKVRLKEGAAVLDAPASGIEVALATTPATTPAPATVATVVVTPEATPPPRVATPASTPAVVLDDALVAELQETPPPTPEPTPEPTPVGTARPAIRLPEDEPASTPVPALPARPERPARPSGPSAIDLPEEPPPAPSGPAAVALPEDEPPAAARPVATSAGPTPAVLARPGDRVVSLAGDGEFRDIGSAILKAGEGERIVVRAGTYSESLRIDRPVTIVAEGGRGSVVVASSSEHAVFMEAASATLRGLVLHCTAPASRRADAVLATSGALRLEDCELIGESLHGLEAAGGSTSVVLEDCRVRSCRESGLLFRDGASGEVLRTEIRQNARAGVALRGGANPLFRDCKIHSGGEGGVVASDAARGRFVGCEIAGNALAGVTLSGPGTQTAFEKCRVRDGMEAGVFALDAARGSLVDCEISGNRLAGLTVSDGASPSVRGGRIRGNRGGGVLVMKNGRGELTDVTIDENENAGLLIDAGGAPSVRGCRIVANRMQGVYARAGAAGIVEGCDLSGNREGAIALEPGASLRDEGNRK